MNKSMWLMSRALCRGVVVVGLSVGVPGCSVTEHGGAGRGVEASLLPMPSVPGGASTGVSGAGLPAFGGVSGPEFGTARAAVTDTRTHAPGDAGPWRGETHTPGEFVPPHEWPVVPTGQVNDLPVGVTGAEPSAVPGPLFPGIGQTEWVPPDPTIAVGPDHVVATVNMKIAFWDKAGNQQYINWLSDSGNPGFFEPVGGAWFTFDPKCFYDHLAQRFVVVAPEVYGSDQAWICIAVSDDADPNGVWYLYRTDAVVWEGDQSFWWDYPGFGYDADAYYVTSNLFGLNQSGWGGVGVRVFKKEPLLTGQTAEYWTMRDGGSASAQVAQHFGPNQAPYLVSLASSSRLRVHAIKDPITNPRLVSADVDIPTFRGPGGAPAAGGNTVSLVDARLFDAQWRNGELYTAHNTSTWDGRNLARWYHLKTNNWPTSGQPSLVQSGNIDAGPGMHTYFPAVYSNDLGQVGLVHGMSSTDTTIAVAVTGRNQSDPEGTMGAPVVLKQATVNSGGRWGDYYDIALDPADETTFWVVGEYPESFGWSTWIGSFSVDLGDGPVAVWDDAGPALAGQAAAIDVTANDYHAGAQPFYVWYYDTESAAGGTVTRSSGTGTDGRDELIYTAPAGYEGPDSFDYTIADAGYRSSHAIVVIEVHDPALFREPDAAAGALPGLDAAYYTLSQPQQLPDFTQLSPYATAVSGTLDYPSSGGPFADSGRGDEVGAVFGGYLLVPGDGVYDLFIESDDGSRLLIGDEVVADNDGVHGMLERSGRIGLRQGVHAVRVEFFEQSGDAGLIARIAGGGLAKQVIPEVMWLRPNPCPADFNGSGAVNTADFVAFLNAWVRGDPRADFTGDGVLDTADFVAFLNLWAAGCP